jgi:cytochrome P450
VSDSTSTAQRLGREYLDDPYSTWRAMREERPVRPVIMPRGLRVWLVTRYADVRAALADPKLAKDYRRLDGLFARHHTENLDPEANDGTLGAHMLNSDPPDHERLRRLVNKAFTARRIEQLRPRIQQITDGLLDSMSGDVDLLDAFAFPLPITVICDLLGMSTDGADDFRRWTTLLLGAGGPDVEPAEVGRAEQSMVKALVDLTAAKRAHPGDDMLSALVQARDADDRLSEAELTATAFLLLVAGHETTVNLIGNGMLALLEHPEQLAALRADLSLLPGAIEEMLRYQGPLRHATMRYTAAATEVGDVVIPADELVMLSVASANRDGVRFTEPDGLDIRRDPGGHLAFGHGIHYCLGAPLARLEAQIAFTGLLTRFPGLELAVPADELRWRPGNLIRGLAELPVRLG